MVNEFFRSTVNEELQQFELEPTRMLPNVVPAVKVVVKFSELITHDAACQFAWHKLFDQQKQIDR